MFKKVNMVLSSFFFFFFLFSPSSIQRRNLFSNLVAWLRGLLEGRMIPALVVMNSFSTSVHTWLESSPCMGYAHWIPPTRCFGLSFSISLTSKRGNIGDFENKQPNSSASIRKTKGGEKFCPIVNHFK